MFAWLVILLRPGKQEAAHLKPPERPFTFFKLLEVFFDLRCQNFQARFWWSGKARRTRQSWGRPPQRIVWAYPSLRKTWKSCDFAMATPGATYWSLYNARRTKDCSKGSLASCCPQSRFLQREQSSWRLGDHLPSRGENSLKACLHTARADSTATWRVKVACPVPSKLSQLEKAPFLSFST